MLCGTNWITGCDKLTIAFDWIRIHHHADMIFCYVLLHRHTDSYWWHEISRAPHRAKRTACFPDLTNSGIDLFHVLKSNMAAWVLSRKIRCDPARRNTSAKHWANVDRRWPNALPAYFTSWLRSVNATCDPAPQRTSKLPSKSITPYPPMCILRRIIAYCFRNP